MMFTNKNIRKTYKSNIVTSIVLSAIMLAGISISEDRHIVFAQTNDTQNTTDKLNIENESASSQTDL